MKISIVLTLQFFISYAFSQDISASDLIGQWKVDSIFAEMDSAEFYHESYVKMMVEQKSERLNNLFDIPLWMKFRKKYAVVFSKGGQRRRYAISFFDNEVWLRYSDYVISLEVRKFSDLEVSLLEGNGLVKGVIQLVKQ